MAKVRTIEAADFERLQRVSRELEQAERHADYTRQAYIATPDERHRLAWVEALRGEQRTWNRYWRTHEEYLIEIR